MKLDQSEACKKIRALSSEDAVEWLIANYSFETGSAGEAYVIMPHRSWTKRDQTKLAEYFLSNVPHRSDRGYKAFLKFMSLPRFIKALERHLPEDRQQRDLMRYHLLPIFNSHPDREKNKTLIDAFCEALT